jgi:hypothetical protein
MMKKLLLLSAASLTMTAAAHAQDARRLDTFAFTGEFLDEAQTIERVELVGIFWDERCAAVDYTYNSSGAPNLFFGAPISTAQTIQAVQDGLDRWNANPASYIEMNVTEARPLGFRTRRGFDFVNEVTFLTASTFTALASSPSTSLQEDTLFVAGQDLNGDGNPDVFDPEVEGRNTCFDADGDGDFEFPAGFYKAGTILDNDVQFSSSVFWELTPSDTGGADIDAVSTHEFGHSHGHAHAILNQISDTDGSGTTMFPFIDTGDALAEATTRTLHTDDLAISAQIYPEGSSTEGIAALQAGDVRFEDAYDVISGEVLNGEGVGVLGAALTAINEAGERVVSTYSGSSQAVAIGTDVFLFAGNGSVINGEYKLPVPKGSSYTVALQALDGDPVAAGRVNTNAIIGELLGQNAFPEEFYNRGTESDSEARPDRDKSLSGDQDGIDLITDRQTVVRNHDGQSEFIGTGAIRDAEQITYGEAFSADLLLPALQTNRALVAGRAFTDTFDPARPVVFTGAALHLGRPDGEGGFEITRTLKEVEGSFGQDNDYAPVFFNGTKGLSQKIEQALKNDPSLQVLFTLSTDVLNVGPSGFPSNFVPIDTSSTGNSYLGIDGSPLQVLGSGTWLMELRLAP